MDIIFAALMGAMIGVAVNLYISSDNGLSDCAKANNMYACKLIAVPVEGK